MTEAEKSRQRAERCMQLAANAKLLTLKSVLLGEAEAWLGLAEEQERAEQRTRRELHELSL